MSSDTTTMSLTGALLEWLSSCFSASLSAPGDCSDGVRLANILAKIDAEHFSQKWLATVKVTLVLWFPFFTL